MCVCIVHSAIPATKDINNTIQLTAVFKNENTCGHLIKATYTTDTNMKRKTVTHPYMHDMEFMLFESFIKYMRNTSNTCTRGQMNKIL